MPGTTTLILGGGFGGIYAARRLEKTLARRPDVEVVLVNRENYLLFTPMLHEVAAGDLYPGDIVNPLRKMLRRAGWKVGVATGSRSAADYCPAHRKPPISETGEPRA